VLIPSNFARILWESVDEKGDSLLVSEIESIFGGTMVPVAATPTVMTACDLVSTWIATPARKDGHEIVSFMTVKYWLTSTGGRVRES